MNKVNPIIDRITSTPKKQFLLFFVVLIILSLIMVYVYMPFCPGHDSYFHHRRLLALMEGITDNPFLIYLDYLAIEEYGYFTKAFYSDFVLIPFAVIGNLTSLEFAYQFMIFSMTVLCGLFTYLAVNKIYKNPYAAAIGAILYTFAIYRLLDFYHRGALGEALSFTFVPIVIWGIYEIIKGDYRKWYILSIGFSLMILTHVLSSLLMLLTILIFLFIYYKSFVKEPQRLKYLIISAIVTIPLIAYYIFPMIEQMLSNTFRYQVEPLTSIKENVLGTYAVIWGLFSGIVYPERAFIPGTGLLLTCAIALRVFVYDKSQKLKSIDIGVIIGLFFIFASSYLFPWGIFPFNKLEIIQMPWRLYEFSSFFFAIAGGYYLSLLLKSNIRKLVGIGVIIIATVFLMVNDAKMYHDIRCNTDLVNINPMPEIENNYQLIGLEYLPSNVPSLEYLKERGNKINTDNPSTSISNITRERNYLSFNIQSASSDIIELPLIYYKGYSAKLNEKDIPIRQSDNGLLELHIQPAENGSVNIYYAGTAWQKIGWASTLISFILLIIYIFIRKKEKVDENGL